MSSTNSTNESFHGFESFEIRYGETDTAALDQTKLDFIRSKFYIVFLLFENFISFVLNSTDLFHRRAGNDIDRTKRFTEIVNKHCSNARRNKNKN